MLTLTKSDTATIETAVIHSNTILVTLRSFDGPYDTDERMLICIDLFGLMSHYATSGRDGQSASI